MVAPLRTGKWNLSDLKDVPKNGFKVFSCFHCGGGSTMGYKLAGYEVLGGVEIDPEMMELYRRNHRPKHSYLMGIQAFNKIPDSDLPDELFQLDILDGSPPCSSFSMAGAREKKWGKASKFREGQAVQVLDDLFFHFIETAKRLQPNVIVAENVKGLIQGNAKGYVKEIFSEFRKAGYCPQLFLFNASAMGVPQARERTIFIAKRSDVVKADRIAFDFKERVITAFTATDGSLDGYMANSANVRHCRDGRRPKWDSRTMPAPTLISSGGLYVERRRRLKEWETCTGIECQRLQSFPDDYDFRKTDPGYVCGMSVPPFMMQRIADQIERQWLSKI